MEYFGCGEPSHCLSWHGNVGSLTGWRQTPQYWPCGEPDFEKVASYSFWKRLPIQKTGWGEWMLFLAVRVIGRKKGGGRGSRNCSREIVSPPHSCHCVCVCFMNSMKLDWFTTLCSQTTKSHKEYGGSLSKVEKLATGGIFFHFSLSEEMSAQLDWRAEKIEIFWNISKIFHLPFCEEMSSQLD